ncbi:SMP-30/gluconolactonase/LRE family protein [Actinomadura fulvescens]|uniref:SMP-30/gluconolactonase/LRE family protein n=1 Tax=Actinomadura fulvescens TaxID=46160 RepID=A0ABN3PG10_9ACTN
MRSLDTLITGGAFFEGPRWHDGRLWVSDFWRHHVLAVSLDGTAETVAEVPGSPSGIGWLPDGTQLIVSMMDNKLLRLDEDGKPTVYADLSPHAGAGTANDMVVDAYGRAYVGCVDIMDWDNQPTTVLLRVDPGGDVAVVSDGMAFPNGPVITPDGATLIIAESWAERLTAFDLAPDGSLTGRRVWADTPGSPPDGITLDAEGAVWMADAGGNRALRVREGGEVLEEISAGDLGVFACTLGGEDGRTLFLCAAPTYDPEEAAKIRQARVLTCRVDVPHAGRP